MTSLQQLVGSQNPRSFRADNANESLSPGPSSASPRSSSWMSLSARSTRSYAPRCAVELKELQKRLGITFVFVTHDQEEALMMSDRVAVMCAGRVEQIGTVDEIYYRPATRFVATFIGETNIVEADLLASRGDFVRCRLRGGLELDVRAGPIADGGQAPASSAPREDPAAPRGS